MERYQASARKTVSSLQVDVHARGVHTTIDEPKQSGGTNTGMNPVELELCALGTSLQETAVKLAPTHGFHFERLAVNLEGDLDPAGFMGDPNVRNGFQEIRLNLQFKTPESQADCEKFADAIEAACPIEDMLQHGVAVALDKVEII